MITRSGTAFVSGDLVKEAGWYDTALNIAKNLFTTYAPQINKIKDSYNLVRGVGSTLANTQPVKTTLKGLGIASKFINPALYGLQYATGGMSLGGAVAGGLTDYALNNKLNITDKLYSKLTGENPGLVYSLPMDLFVRPKINNILNKQVVRAADTFFPLHRRPIPTSPEIEDNSVDANNDNFTPNSNGGYYA
jgi:hypothetical protein